MMYTGSLKFFLLSALLGSANAVNTYSELGNQLSCPTNDLVVETTTDGTYEKCFEYCCSIYVSGYFMGVGLGGVNNCKCYSEECQPAVGNTDRDKMFQCKYDYYKLGLAGDHQSCPDEELTSEVTTWGKPSECSDACCSGGGGYFLQVGAGGKDNCKCYAPGCSGGAPNTSGSGPGSGSYDSLYGCGQKPKPAASGDPHFETWTGEKFDFHGGCDLVLLHNREFANGLGLHVHIRTEIDTWWSYIKAASVRIGDNTLEIVGGKKKIQFWLDGVQVANMETGVAALGDFQIKFNRMSEHQSQTRIDVKQGNALSIETYKRFVRVNVKVADQKAFAGTYGILGSFPGGRKVARDKTTVLENANEFGQEWMVLPTEPKLFHDESPVQHGMKCPMPKTTQKSQKRRLGESFITEEDAGLACARVPEADRDACIFDVLATQDKDMAGSY